MQQGTTRKLANRKGVEIETPYSDGEAFKKLSALVDSGTLDGFAASLVQNGRRYNSISQEQFFWIHKLLLDHENPSPDQAYVNIAGSFARAEQNGVPVRNLKINIKDEFLGETVRLQVAGFRSKYKGQIWVLLPESDVYCGRITTGGIFYRTNACPDEIVDRLDIIEDNTENYLPW